MFGLNPNTVARCLTWPVNYAYFLAIMYIADTLFANHSDLKDTTSRLTWLRHFAVLAIGPLFGSQILDVICMAILPESIIPKAKLQPFEKAKSLPVLGYDQVRLLCTIVTVSWLLGPLGIAYWTPVFMGSALEVAWTIQKFVLEAYAVWLLKDITSMYFVHRWMHNIPSMWWLHKYHHTYTKEMSFPLGFSFDILDLLLENASGLLFWLPIKYALTGDATLHVGVYLCVIWFDHTTHMANPHTATLLNPLLDYMFRANVNHQLHHVIINGHYTLFPGHHLLPSSRQADLDHYNKVFNTKID